VAKNPITEPLEIGSRQNRTTTRNMTKLFRQWSTCIAVATVVIGCGNPAGPNDLLPTLQIQPDTVVPGDTFHVTVTIENPTSDTVALWSGSGCLFVLSVWRDGQNQHFDGTDWGCLDTGIRFFIEPGHSLVREHDVVALALDSQAPFAYVASPPAGDYTVRAQMEVQLADMEGSLVVAVPARR
jgi:hypothetical protein